jgi:hypothetical protein
VIPRWEWAKQFAHTVVTRDLITEILSAAGVAENAFNEGLVRGFLFGERHSKQQADTVRQKAFDHVHRQGYTVGRYVGDDVWSFNRNDVYTLAGALAPYVDWFLAEAARRRAERLERERLEKQAEPSEAVRRRVDNAQIGARGGTHGTSLGARHRMGPDLTGGLVVAGEPNRD